MIRRHIGHSSPSVKSVRRSRVPERKKNLDFKWILLLINFDLFSSRSRRWIRAYIYIYMWRENMAGFQLFVAECFLQLMIKPKVPERKCPLGHKIYGTSLCPCPRGAFKLNVLMARNESSTKVLQDYAQPSKQTCRLGLCECFPFTCRIKIGTKKGTRRETRFYLQIQVIIRA